MLNARENGLLLRGAAVGIAVAIVSRVEGVSVHEGKEA